MAQTCRDRRIVKPSWRNFKKAPQAGNVVAGNDSRRPGRDEQASVLSECFFQRLPLKKLFRKFLLESAVPTRGSPQTTYSFLTADSWISSNLVRGFPILRTVGTHLVLGWVALCVTEQLHETLTETTRQGHPISRSKLPGSRQSHVRTSRRSASLGNPGPSAIACLASTSTSS